MADGEASGRRKHSRQHAGVGELQSANRWEAWGEGDAMGNDGWRVMGWGRRPWRTSGLGSVDGGPGDRFIEDRGKSYWSFSVKLYWGVVVRMEVWRLGAWDRPWHGKILV